MGPPEKQPPLPEYEFATVPAEQTYISKRLQECNWLQALEGGIDSSHSAWLHSGEFADRSALCRRQRATTTRSATCSRISRWWRARRPPIGARRNAEAGKYYWRITQWVMPCMTMIPPRGDHPTGGHFWVPIDDENCWVWNWDYHATRPLTEAEAPRWRTAPAAT